MKAFNLLKEASKEGRDHRRTLNNAIEWTGQEFHGIGIEMNQRYAGTQVQRSIWATRRKQGELRRNGPSTRPSIMRSQHIPGIDCRMPGLIPGFR
jgi:hypothetical protein